MSSVHSKTFLEILSSIPKDDHTGAKRSYQRKRILFQLPMYCSHPEFLSFPKKFMVCQRNHHTLIHLDETPRVSTSTLSVSTNSTNRSRSHMKECLNRRSRTHVFLPTLLALTVVLRNLVDRLALHTTGRKDQEFCTLNLKSYHDPSVKI